MKLYDEIIGSINEILKPFEPKQLEAPLSDWADSGNGNMILRSDMAYELGGGNMYALSSLCITVNSDLVPEDEILLYGDDLPDIKQDTPYARLTLLLVDEKNLGEGNSLYNAIRKMEYVRYHLNPEGYMMRISPSKDREPARIGKAALKNGLNFANVGKSFINEFHKDTNIKAVKIIFITMKDFPYKKLDAVVKKNEQITSAIDHIMKDLVMDCNACNLKPICDEVEGMKELHFAQRLNE